MHLSGTWSNGLIATLLFSTLAPAIELDINDEGMLQWIRVFDGSTKDGQKKLILQLCDRFNQRCCKYEYLFYDGMVCRQ